MEKKILKEIKLNTNEAPKITYYNFNTTDENIKSFCSSIKEKDKEILKYIPASLLSDTDENIINIDYLAKLSPLSRAIEKILAPFKKLDLFENADIELNEDLAKVIGNINNRFSLEAELNNILLAQLLLNEIESYSNKFIFQLDLAFKELIDKYSLLELELDSIAKSDITKIRKYIRDLVDIPPRADIKEFLKSLKIINWNNFYKDENSIILSATYKKKLIEKEIDYSNYPFYIERLNKTINTIKDIIDKLSDKSLLVPAVYSPAFFDITKFVNITKNSDLFINKKDNNRHFDLYVLDKNNKLLMPVNSKFTLLTEKLIMKICINYNERNDIKLDTLEFMRELNKITTERAIKRFKIELRKEIFILSKLAICLNNTDFKAILDSEYNTKGDIWSVSLSKSLFNSLKGDYKKELFSQYHKNLFKVNSPIAYEIGKKLVYSWNLNKYHKSKTFKTDTKGKRTNIISVEKLLENIIDTTPERILTKENGDTYKKKDIGLFIINPFKEALEKLIEAGVIVSYSLASGNYEEQLEGNIEYTIAEAPDLIIEREIDYIDIIES